jgi:hypothetical protein
MVGGMPLGEGSGATVRFKRRGRHLWLVNGWEAAMRVFDVEDPDRPVQLARLAAAKQDGYSFDLALVDDVALVVERKAGLGIVDVSNPAEPVRIGGAPGCSGYGQRDIRTLLPGRGTMIDLEITREVAASPLPQVLSGEAALRPPPGILTPRNPIVAETTCHFT